MSKKKKQNEVSASTLSVAKQYQKRSQMAEIFYRVRKNKGAMVGFCILAFMFILLIVSLFMPWRMVSQGSVMQGLSPPSLEHPFGLDFMGRSRQ
jgi:ABC-type dipeptide/oligopeptide/nickel transport system permease subunit